MPLADAPLQNTPKENRPAMPDMNPAPAAREYDALIIGAGFSGLYQLLCLRDRLGL